MPDQKDKAQEKNRLERLQEEHGDEDTKHKGGAGEAPAATPAQANPVHQKFPLLAHRTMPLRHDSE